MPLSPYDLRRVTNFADLLNLMTVAGPPRTQTPGLLVPGTIDLVQRPAVINPDGSLSSVHTIGITDENPTSPYYGLQVNIPSVIPDAQGRYYTENWQDDPNHPQPAARAYYYKTGEHLGVFSSVEASNAAAQQLHEDYAKGVYGGGYTPFVPAYFPLMPSHGGGR